VRVYVESYGCSQNQGEAAAIARAVRDDGHEVQARPEGADVGVLVTCAVIGPTEARMVRRWEMLARTVPRVVVTGCLVPLRTSLLEGPGRERTTIVPIREQRRIPTLLAEWAGRPGVERSDPPVATSRLAERPPIIEEVVIAQGCTSACTYCFSRLARGHLESVPLSHVLRRVASASSRGVAEIRLTSLDTSAWGHDLGPQPRLPDLLSAIAQVPTDAGVRVGMMSPQTLHPILDTYLDALAPERFYRFLHLPVQSGSDSILAAMHRGYTVEEFRRQVARARTRYPALTLATDVIVGFPGETDADHRATEELLTEIEPEIVNVTRYSARPGTVAARLVPIGPAVAKRRSRALTALRQRQARRRLERWIGHRGFGRVLEHGPGTSSVARLPNYLPVVLEDRFELGATIPLRIEGVRSTYLLGRADPAFGTD
jgi:threonylcarbamoyladenosine tRNA methylthiotransferase CDKAL1